MKNMRVKVATGVTVILLGGLTGVALSSGGEAADTAAVAEKPLVRTKVIRRTIHVTKHAKPSPPAAADPGGGATETAAESSYRSAIAASSSGGAYSASPSVTTSSSGSVPGRGEEYAEHEPGDEHESEGGDD